MYKFCVLLAIALLPLVAARPYWPGISVDEVLNAYQQQQQQQQQMKIVRHFGPYRNPKPVIKQIWDKPMPVIEGKCPRRKRIPGLFSFMMGDYNNDGIPDLYALKRTATETGTTEVHVLCGRSHFKKFLLQTRSALHQTHKINKWDFVLSDQNRDGKIDIIAVKKYQTGCRKTEAHALNGATYYKTFLYHTCTSLHETKDRFSFTAMDFNKDGNEDLVAVKRYGTGTHTTELHVLDRASMFKKFILQTGTKLHQIPRSQGFAWSFHGADWNRDGTPDMVVVKGVHGSGCAKAEMHVLNGATNFQTYLHNSCTAMHTVGNNGNYRFLVSDYDQDKRPDLVVVKQRKTGTCSTEVHIVSAKNWSTFILQTGTRLHETGYHTGPQKKAWKWYPTSP